MPDGQAVGLGTQSVRLSEPTALVVPNGHAKQGSLDLPVEYVPTGHCWQLSPVKPASKMATLRQLGICGDCRRFTSFFPAKKASKQTHFQSHDNQLCTHASMSCMTSQGAHLC
jgi:hypothetical protein